MGYNMPFIRITSRGVAHSGRHNTALMNGLHLHTEEEEEESESERERGRKREREREREREI